MKPSVITIAVMLAGTGGAFAQQADQNKNDQNSQRIGRTERTADEIKVSDQELEKRVSDINKASKFVGLQVKNTRNETVGKVSDLALDLKSGRIAYAVVSVGGFLGVGDKLVAVPIEALAVEKGAKHLLLDVDKRQVEQASGFSENSWPDLDAVKSGKTIGFTAKADNAKGAGGTGSETEEASGKDRGARHAASEPITTIQAVHSNSDPLSLKGKQVRLSEVKVLEVVGGNFATVGADQDQQKLLIKTQTGAPQVTAGQTISLAGTIREMPADMSKLGLDAEAAQKMQGQKVYIDAGQVTPVPAK